MKGRGVAILVALAVHGVVACWLTWPLAAELGRALPDPSPVTRADVSHGLWALAWQTRALASEPARVAEAPIYHPDPHALFYAPTGTGALAAFAPVALATGSPVLALGIVFLGALVLAAVALDRLVAGATGSAAAGCAAGWTWLAMPAAAWGLGSMPHYASVALVPLVIGEAAGRTRPGRLAVLASLAAFADPVYVAPAVFGALAATAVVDAWHPGTRAAAARAFAAIAMAAVVLAPVYAGYLAVWRANPGLAAQTFWRAGASPPGGSLPPTAPIALSPFALGMAAASLPRLGRLGRHAIVWAATGVALLGLVHAGGPALVRMPDRLAYPAALAVALLAGLGWALVADWLADPARGGLPRRWVVPLLLAVYGGVLAVDLRDRMPDGFAVRAAGFPPSHAALLVGGEGPVLELPVGAAGVSPMYHVRAMLAAIVHGRPLLNGYGSYWPAGFPERMRLANELPDPNVLAELRRVTGVTTIVVHLDDLPRGPRVAWDGAAAGGRRDLIAVRRAPGVVLFDVRAP